MSLDTKYRPRTYGDLIGQDPIVAILKEYVRSGSGAHQSYFFSGAFGTGKTTTARILARALLCTSPVDGEACDACDSCRSLLETGSSENFIEIDAATNSGKDNIRKIVEELGYSTFSGKRRIYLFDECHRLSKDALDALLKPLEENVPGSDDKLLVCLFCTTEPEAMRATLLSRCAPAFRIRPVSPEDIANRLAKVCMAEGIPYERDALVLIAELTECHIRDALKSIEGVSMMGAVTRANVSSYLHLDYTDSVFRILETIASDLPTALQETERVLKALSPVTLYERLVDGAMLAYRSTLGPVSVPGYIATDRVTIVGQTVGSELLRYADRFSRRTGRPTQATLICDIAFLSRGYVVGNPGVETKPTITPSTALPKSKSEGPKPSVVDGVYVSPRAINVREAPPVAHAQGPTDPDMRPSEFLRLVARRVRELTRGSEGQTNMGGA